MRALLVLVAAAAASAKPQSDTVVPVTAGNDCLSEACVAASHRLFTSMNRTADPCVDFNEFACGRFEDEAHIPDDKGRWDASFSPITEEIYERGRGLMEEKSRDDDFDAYRKARVFYQSCVDEDHLEELGVDPLKKVLAEVGGWPVIDGDAWQGKDTYNWYDAVAKLAQIGFGKDFFVSLQVSTDDKDSLARVIFMDQPDLGIDREYLVKGFDDPDIQSYFRYMNDTAILLGADPTKSQADLKSALLLEIALANASAPREERRNSSLMYNPFILGELERLDGHPPSWTDYVASLLEPAVEITDKERIIVQNPAYLKKMAPIVLAADRRTLANYVGWRAAVSAMSHLNREAKDIKQRYDKAIHGTNERTPTWKKCVREVGFNSFSGASLGIGISSMYVKRFFPAEAKTSMVNMINYIRKGFSSILDNIDWMDTTTRGKAHDKLDQMIQFIGYPDELLDKSKVDGLFAALDIQEGDYLGNVLKLIKWWREFTYKRLRQPVDKKDWVDHSAVALVNAFYNPSVNSIEFPAGILQGAFFDHRVPAYLNFGAIGAVIGHEITHGFDDQGRQYDGEGNLRDWWDPSTNDNFVKRAQCIVEQYGNYSVKQVDLNLNGINTQGENIADNGGIKEAYVGYDNWVKDNGEEKMLPGLGYTPRQMFWISWGQVWCSKYRDAAMKNQVQTGAHSPGIYRIIGPLSNSADFARDFNCPKSTAMNPDNKCTVW